MSQILHNPPRLPESHVGEWKPFPADAYGKFVVVKEDETLLSKSGRRVVFGSYAGAQRKAIHLNLAEGRSVIQL